MRKNFNAVALGRMGKGKKKTMSNLAIKARLKSMAKAREARWRIKLASLKHFHHAKSKRKGT